MKPLETATMVIPEDRDAFQTAITNSVAMRPDGGQVLLITTPVTTPATLAANKTTAVKTERINQQRNGKLIFPIPLFFISINGSIEVW